MKYGGLRVKKTFKSIQWISSGWSWCHYINLYHYIIPLLYHDSPWLSHDSPINETNSMISMGIPGSEKWRFRYIPWTIALTQAMISRLRLGRQGSVEAHWDVGLLDRSRGKAKKPAEWWADEWYFKGLEWWRSMVIDDDQWWLMMINGDWWWGVNRDLMGFHGDSWWFNWI